MNQARRTPARENAHEMGSWALGRALVIQSSRLAGFRHHAAPSVWLALRRGAPLTLALETDNPADPDAVAVFWRGRKLGYLPRSENLVAARLLGRQRRLSARVRSLVPAAEPNARLRLDVLMH